jgi:hypothetical protein
MTLPKSRKPSCFSSPKLYLWLGTEMRSETDSQLFLSSLLIFYLLHSLLHAKAFRVLNLKISTEVQIEAEREVQRLLETSS